MEAEWKGSLELHIKGIAFDEVLEFFDVPGIARSPLHDEPPVLFLLPARPMADRP